MRGRAVQPDEEDLALSCGASGVCGIAYETSGVFSITASKAGYQPSSEKVTVTEDICTTGSNMHGGAMLVGRLLGEYGMGDPRSGDKSDTPPGEHPTAADDSVARGRVIGINDYIFLDGYRRILEYKAAGRLQNIDLFLPVVELRLNHFGGTDGDLSRLNLHVIFSDELGPDAIQSQFINGLKCDVSLMPDGALNEGMILEEALLLEIVRPGSGEPVAPGEVGEVVITSFNRDYPLIRFGTGDLSAVLAGASPCGRTNVRIKGWMGRADQSTKVRAMFVTPTQVNEVLRRHRELARARLVIEGEGGEDRMTLHCEARERPSGLAQAIIASIRDVTKLRGEVLLVEPGSLPNDGKVIEDKRRYT